MDSYSGRFPLDVFSLCSIMSSGEINESVPVQSSEDLEKEQTEPVRTQGPPHQTAAGNSLGERPIEQSHTPTSFSSSSATESLSTYAERTGEAILAREELNVTFPFPGVFNQVEGPIG